MAPQGSVCGCQRALTCLSRLGNSWHEGDQDACQCQLPPGNTAGIVIALSAGLGHASTPQDNVTILSRERAVLRPGDRRV